MKRLMVIIPDRVSEVLAKGEYQPGYYNPGDLFDEVHILMTNDDSPSLADLQRTVGRATLFVHNHPDDLNLVNCHPSWLRNLRLRNWARGAVGIARSIRPDLVRCHGADWNVFIAARIKAELGVPYVVSLHINPDVNPVRRIVKKNLSREERRHNSFYEYIESVGLRAADLVMPVYRPIIPYLDRLGVERVEVCYNVLNNKYLRTKCDYTLHDPPRIIYVGRLFQDKNPENILRALVRLPEAILTIVGDGAIRPRLEEMSRELGVSDRVVFRPAIANDALCELLSEQDIFAVHTEYWEISKSVLEALLTGLPVVINKRHGEPVPELQGDFVRFVENTEESYFQALNQLLTDNDMRRSLGRRAFAHARTHWDPILTEARYANIYRSFLSN